MPNTRQNDIKYNNSGYMDNTAYYAIKNIQKEERKQLISQIKELAKRHGYEVTSIIRLRALGDEEE